MEPCESNAKEVYLHEWKSLFILGVKVLLDVCP